MGVEPPVLDQQDAPAGPEPERRSYVRRMEERRNLLPAVISLIFAICGGLAVIFLFFAAMGAIDFGDAAVATGVAAVMGLVWFAGFYYRHRTHHSDVILAERRDRERRGF